MSEWLTTGQMIDRLMEGEVAEAEDSVLSAKWDRGRMVITHYGGESREVITKFDKERRWRILPRFVPFEKAWEEFKKGKIISSYKNGVYYDDYHIDDLDKVIELNEMLNMEWVVSDSRK